MSCNIRGHMVDPTPFPRRGAFASIGAVGNEWGSDHPPHIPQFENAILATLLCNPSKSYDTIDAAGLRPEHFYYPINQRIYGEIVRRLVKGEPATAPAMGPWLEQDPEIKEIGGAGSYLADVVNGLLSYMKEDLRQYVRTLQDYAARRNIIDAARELMRSARDLNVQIDDALDQAMRDLDGAEFTSSEQPSCTLYEAAEKAIKIAHHARTTGKPAGFTIAGFPRLGEIMQFRPGEVTILAGVPGSGKSAMGWYMLIDLAWQLAERLGNGEPLRDVGGVFGISLEMSEEALAFRALSAMTGIPAKDIPKGRLTDMQFESLEIAKQQLKSLPLLFIAAGGKGVSWIKKRAAQVRRRFQGKINAVLVDHVSLIRPEDDKNGGAWGMRMVADSLLGLCKPDQLNCHIFGLCQVDARELSKLPWDQRRPEKQHLRWTQSWSENADAILTLYRPVQSLPDRQPEQDITELPRHYETRIHEWRENRRKWERRARLWIDKNRHGEEKRELELLFDGPTISMTEDPGT